MGLLKKLEKEAISQIHERLEIKTELDSDSLVLRTSTYFDGVLVHTHDLGLSGLVDIITQRVLDEFEE